jgi:hypothetical protein
MRIDSNHIENIQKKFSEVYNREENNHGDIFLGHKGKDEREWLILGYMTRMLKIGKELYPVYADKTNPPEPDFITYDSEKKLFFPIEITEILHPNRKRGDEYKEIQKEEKRWNKLTEEEQRKEIKNIEVTIDRKLLNNSEWVSQIIQGLSGKFEKRYNPATWLLIYFNIPYGHIAMYGSWHSTMEYNVKEIMKNNAELQKPPYSRILMTDCEGDSMIQIYPGVYTIKESVTKPFGTERNLDKW